MERTASGSVEKIPEPSSSTYSSSRVYSLHSSVSPSTGAPPKLSNTERTFMTSENARWRSFSTPSARRMTSECLLLASFLARAASSAEIASFRTWRRSRTPSALASRSRLRASTACSATRASSSSLSCFSTSRLLPEMKDRALARCATSRESSADFQRSNRSISSFIAAKRRFMSASLERTSSQACMPSSIWSVETLPETPHMLSKTKSLMSALFVMASRLLIDLMKPSSASLKRASIASLYSRLES